jgi:hypothetical protein
MSTSSLCDGPCMIVTETPGAVLGPTYSPQQELRERSHKYIVVYSMSADCY